MNKRFLMMAVLAAVILPLAILGCKAKVEKTQASPETTSAGMVSETVVPSTETLATPEPAQTVATETIPPSAAPQVADKPAQQQAVAQDKASRNKEIQTALKNAGFYAGAVDGKLGPKTRKAIEAFQKSKSLKADGKVGPKTWAELQSYLVQQ